MTAPTTTAHPSELTVLHSDAHVLAVSKPAGLVTHPSPQARERVSALSIARAIAGRWVYPAHRLDRATSGVLLFGLSPETATALGAALADRRASKTYLAVVRGHMRGHGTIDKPLESEPGGPMQDAVTHWQALSHAVCPWPVRPYPSARYTLVELRPVTGRTHQLRKHMRGLSHPIIGDTRLGDGAHNRAFADNTGVDRLMLHASQLTIPHPETGESLRIEAALPASFAAGTAMFAGT